MSDSFHAKTSRFAFKKHTSASSYSGLSVEPMRRVHLSLDIGTSLASFVGLNEHVSHLAVSKDAEHLRNWLLGELIGGDERIREVEALNVAFVCVLKLGADGDESLGSGHLQLQAGVVGDLHELRVCRPPEDHVIRSREADDLECECFLAKIPLVAEGDH
jgi:hypothetical protein